MINYGKMDSIMKSKGITMYQIAKSSGMRYATVYNFFKRHTKNPSFGTVAAVCKVLGISVDEVVM